MRSSFFREDGATATAWIPEREGSVRLLRRGYPRGGSLSLLLCMARFSRRSLPKGERPASWNWCALIQPLVSVVWTATGLPTIPAPRR